MLIDLKDLIRVDLDVEVVGLAESGISDDRVRAVLGPFHHVPAARRARRDGWNVEQIDVRRMGDL